MNSGVVHCRVQADGLNSNVVCEMMWDTWCSLEGLRLSENICFLSLFRESDFADVKWSKSGQFSPVEGQQAQLVRKTPSPSSCSIVCCGPVQ